MRKSAITGIVASIGVMLLPQHQLQNESHCDWYKRAVDSLTHRDNRREARPERPDFRRRHLTVSTREVQGTNASVEPVEVGLAQKALP